MDISGNYTLNAPREQVWDALLDPDLLKRSIPGCESLEQTGDNQYAVRLNIAVAGVKGAYQGTLRLLEAHKPDSYRVVVDGAGARGIVHSDGVVRLEANPAGTTDIHYAGQAQLGGTIASLGAQVARGAGNMLMREYFSRMADLLPAMPATPVATPAIAPVATPVATPISSYESAVAVPEVEPVSVSTPASAAPMGALSTPAPAPVEPVAPPAAAPNIAPPPPEERVAPPATPTLAATGMAPPAPAAAPVSTPQASAAQPVRLSDGSAESQRRTAGLLGVVLAVVAIVVVVVVVFVVTGR